MTGHIYTGTNACNGLRVDRQRVAGAALAVDAQRIEAAVLVQVADGERGDDRDLGQLIARHASEWSILRAPLHRQ